MCIRDRSTVGLVPMIERFAAETDVKLAISLNASNDETRSCLLYTSDAADERSSVDLGGRRIIKKKTCKHHSNARSNQNTDE